MAKRDVCPGCRVHVEPERLRSAGRCSGWNIVQRCPRCGRSFHYNDWLYLDDAERAARDERVRERKRERNRASYDPEYSRTPERKAYMREWYRRNAERIKAKKRGRYAAMTEDEKAALLEKQREYQHANIERKRERDRRYYDTHWLERKAYRIRKERDGWKS